MREIKFRAYYKPTNKMLYWVGFKYRSDYQKHWFDYSDNGNPFALEDDSTEIMQYTGLKDKNGKEIYEGDVVTAHYFYFANGAQSEKSEICVVKYFKDNIAFVLAPIDRDDSGYIEPCSCSDEGIEVLGNIYENPELVEDIKHSEI